MIVSYHMFKVYLESLSQADAEELARNANDFDIAYNAASFGEFPYPYRKEHAQNFIDYAASQAQQGAAFHFGIHLDSSGRLIGAAGVVSIDQKNRKCELGYWLGKEHWGKGYAKEAVLLLMHLSFGRLGMNRVCATTFPFNSRSIALLNSIGFKRDGVRRQSRLHYDGFMDEEEYSVLRSEYADIPAIVNL